MQNQYFSTLSLLFFTIVQLSACTLAVPVSTDDSAEGEKNSDYSYTSDYQNEDRIYVDYIKTVLLYPLESPLLPPFIDLNGNLPLELRFDDLRGGYETYYYSVTHCTFDWQESDLLPSEYLSGFQELSITEMEQSFNTVQNYTNYYATWPNDMSRPTRSGNYLLKVYADGNADAPVFTRRIVVTEQLVRFRPNVKASTIVSERRYRQEVDFDIVQANYPIYDPYEALNVAVLQNYRWDNAITDLKPVFMKGQELVYDFDEENNFDGLNEFRWFDSKSLRFAALGTDSIREINAEWHYFLQPDLRRTYDVYRTDPDIDGKVLIRNDRFNDHLESEYIYVHFYLPMDEPLYQQEVYVFGELTNWQHMPDARMRYNPSTKRYEATLYLKQGYYNYMYSVVSADHPNGDQSFMEGNHQIAENEYTIIAYYFDPQGFDRVIGILSTNSFNQ